MDNEDYHFKLKISVVGDKNVGKSSMIERLSNSVCKRAKLQSSEELLYKNFNHKYDF